MSIKDELTKTASYLRSTRKAILGRGGEISLRAGLKDLPDAIYNIPADASLAYQVDDSVAYQKIVPANTEEFSHVAKIGGMTYKPYNENNIVPYPYEDSQIPSTVGQTNVSNGISITLNDDRSITLNGTGDLDLYFIYGYLSMTKALAVSFGTTLPQGMECVYSESIGYNEELGYEEWSEYRLDMSNGEAVATFYIPRLESVRLVGYNITFNNVRIYPMIADSYTVLPFFEELKSTKVTELRSIGANLFKFPYTWGSQTTYGVTITVNDDGSITFKGSNTGQHYSDFKLNYKTYKLPLGTYTFSGNFPSNMWIDFYTRNENDANIQQTGRITGSKTFAITKEYSYIDCYIRIALNATVDVTIYPMLNYGTTAAPYKPYRNEAVDTFQISEELRAFLEPYGYGLGINSELYNYIDFERKVFVRNSYRYVCTGDETILSSGGNDEDGDTSYLIVGNYPQALDELGTEHFVLHNKLFEHAMDLNLYTGYVCVDFLDLTDYSTRQYVKEQLKARYEAGDPLIIEYPLAEPEEIDISSYLPSDNFIKVEGGGVIKAINQYEQDAPSTLNYIIKAGI